MVGFLHDASRLSPAAMIELGMLKRPDGRAMAAAVVADARYAEVIAGLSLLGFLAATCWKGAM